MKISITLILLLASNLSLAEVPLIAKECFDCHGDLGVSTQSKVPTIAGLSSAFFEASMFSYKDGERPAVESKYYAGDIARKPTDMKKIADLLSDEQIVALANYFAKQKFVSAKQEFDASLVEAGSKIHDMKCKKCHEDGGSSPDDDSGILAGQWTYYMHESMQHYMQGKRKMEDKMKQKVDGMSESELNALLAFYASQQ